MTQPDDDRTRTHVTLTAGTMVSHYRIIERIGAGGMGEVFLAEDTKLHRKVALKFLPPHLCQDPDCRARFTREAEASAQLDHPNIVSVFEVGEFQGRPFFSMQHVEGQSLKEVLAGKALPLDRIVELAIQVCDGLQAAHESGITHRDIKPSNILIDSHGRARIVDFGLASVKGTDHLTKTGSTLGTIGYMSPEQVRGATVDHRTDLFSLGVVLYELITGHSPFRADSEAATLHAITDTKPELLAHFRREIPAKLQTIVDKALEKDVATRYHHADEIATDLKRVSSAAIVQQAPRRNLWNRYAVASAVVLLLAIVGYWGVPKFLAKDGQKPETTRKMLAVLPFENLGSPEDEYFADGITDEITGKLASIRELGVISRTSTMQYKKTTKNLKQIADELGVDYILEGTIRWDKRGDTGRVRIVPQLIRVSDDTHLWAETYQRSINDVFATQADIADRIAETMNITLRQSERDALHPLPTENLDAYHLYLRAEGFASGGYAYRANTDAAVPLLEQAVALDPAFALAHAALAMALSARFHFKYDASPEVCDKAREAASRAIALGPALPHAHLARGCYYYWCLRDYDSALRELSVAEDGLPNDPMVLAVQAYILRRRGDFEAAREKLGRAFKVAPRDGRLAREIASTNEFRHDYPAAEEYLDIAITLEPDRIDHYLNKAGLYISWRADTALARATLTGIPGRLREDDEAVREAWVGLYTLERNYAAALRLLAVTSPREGDTQLGMRRRALQQGRVFWYQGDIGRARQCYDSARIEMEAEAITQPDDFRVHSALGEAYAGLGRNEDAIREGKLAAELLPVSKDALLGIYPVWALAEIYVMTGQHNAALDEIEYLLSIPGTTFSVPMLRLSPIFDPLRSLPRYQTLVEKYGP